MTGTRMKRRGAFALAMLFAIACLANAQNAIKISADPNEKQKTDAFLPDLTVRPNVAEEYFVFVKNPTGDPKTLTVQLRDARGKAIIAQGKVTLGVNDLKRVKLEKVAPPPPPKEAALKEVAPKDTAAKPATPAVEPPPGVELKLAGKKFEFQLWLLDGDKVLEKETRGITILVAQPGSNAFPIAKPQAKSETTANQHEITVPISAVAALRGGPAIVELIVPPQDSLNAGLRAGVYRRQVVPGQTNATLIASNLPFRGEDNKKVRFHLNVDGLPRAFVYETDFQTNPQGTIDALTTPRVSVLPIGAERFVSTKSTHGSDPKAKYSAKPSDKTPVRIEVDNPPANATVEIRFDHRDKGTFAGADVIPLGSARDERVFVDFQGDEGGVQVRYLVGDRIHQLDTRSLRGVFGVQAVLRWEANGKEQSTSDYFYLVLDDTAPEGGRFVQLPTRHVKGTLLTLKAKAEDPETSIKQAVFFVGEPAPDGKLPDLKAKGSFDKKEGLWTAKVPIPDKTGVIQIGVQFENETGVAATETQKIELIDPPAPTGTISGVVELGGRGQAKLVVSLRDADGKEKGSDVTNEKGEFKFENVAPGTYRVLSSKPDSGVGTKGDAPAQVKVGKETKVTITLARKP